MIQMVSRPLNGMKAYIEQHALDANITAGSVCDEVRISASYGSGMYKKFSGKGYWMRYIKSVYDRQRLMLQKNMTVQEVAEKTGYLDARSFIRSLKKYEGITPGQLKIFKGETYEKMVMWYMLPDSAVEFGFL